MTETDYHRQIFGTVIAFLRAQRGLTQEEMGRLVNVAQNTLSRMERGAAPVEWFELTLYAKAVGMPGPRPDVALLERIEVVSARIVQLSKTLSDPNLLEEDIGTPWAKMSSEELSALLRISLLPPREGALA
jgi:transcriptional regulator with XRE-family HTH domain